jgi:hypothetical protein
LKYWLLRVSWWILTWLKKNSSKKSWWIKIFGLVCCHLCLKKNQWMNTTNNLFILFINKNLSLLAMYIYLEGQETIFDWGKYSLSKLIKKERAVILYLMIWIGQLFVYRLVWTKKIFSWPENSSINIGLF